MDEKALASLMVNLGEQVTPDAFAPGWVGYIEESFFGTASAEGCISSIWGETCAGTIAGGGTNGRFCSWKKHLEGTQALSLRELWALFGELKLYVELGKFSTAPTIGSTGGPAYYDQDGRKISSHRIIKECNAYCLCPCPGIPEPALREREHDLIGPQQPAGVGTGEDEVDRKGQQAPPPCRHRRAQLGAASGLEVFHVSKEKGFGVRAKVMIPKSSYLFEYAGEYVDDHEFKRRQHSYLGKRLTMQYGLFLGKYYIDATRFGNIGRFMNHSCEPNVKAIEIFSDHHDLMYPKVGFFAVRDINIGEEITWNYGSLCHDAEMKATDCKCFCNSPSCKRFLPH
uniref:SET domain-containing protein n=1 Tax=Heterosigma akashiwo TaxID=2829 RepID=A0A7S3XR20_HETAK